MYILWKKTLKTINVPWNLECRWWREAVAYPSILFVCIHFTIGHEGFLYYYISTRITQYAIILYRDNRNNWYISLTLRYILFRLIFYHMYVAFSLVKYPSKIIRILFEYSYTYFNYFYYFYLSILVNLNKNTNWEFI